MWNIDTVTKEYGNGVMTPDEVETGFLTITNHTKPIVDAAFSPDGTALATASLDGEVKFFQVYLQDRAPPRYGIMIIFLINLVTRVHALLRWFKVKLHLLVTPEHMTRYFQFRFLL